MRGTALMSELLNPQSWPATPVTDTDLRVDCHGCTARPVACGDCIVTYLLGSPPEGVELNPQEQAALEALADAGLVPALRFHPPTA